MENISIIPVYVIVSEELEISFEKEISILKEFTSKKDRTEYIRRLLKSERTSIKNNELLRIAIVLYSLEISKIIEQEKTMTKQERNIKHLIRTLGFDKELRDEGKEFWLQQGMQQGMQQGAVQTAREVVLEVLSLRFQEVPRSLSERVHQLEDLSVLKELHRKAITVRSLKEFEENLPG